jgi:hypothetical protein
MGYYINKINSQVLGTSFDEKCQGLLDNGATQTSDSEFKENLVCVVDNGIFAAAGYAFSEKEFEYFKMPDTRRKKWFIVPNADVLSGFKVEK